MHDTSPAASHDTDHNWSYDLGEAIASLAAQIDSETRELLALIRDFDQSGLWLRCGDRSCAHWLARRLRIGLGAAREKVRVARRLPHLPAVDKAFERGEISYSKVRAITRVADPDTETELLEAARELAASQLELVCRAKRSNSHARTKAERSVQRRPTSDGLVAVQLRFTPQEAEQFLAALDASRGDGTLIDGAMRLAALALHGHSGCATEPEPCPDHSSNINEDVGSDSAETQPPVQSPHAEARTPEPSQPIVEIEGDEWPVHAEDWRLGLGPCLLVPVVGPPGSIVPKPRTPAGAPRHQPGPRRA